MSDDASDVAADVRRRRRFEFRNPKSEVRVLKSEFCVPGSELEGVPLLTSAATGRWALGLAARLVSAIGLAALMISTLPGCLRSGHALHESGPVRTEVEQWRGLFAGAELDGWRTVQFGGEGEVLWGDGSVILEMGNPFTGIAFTNSVPRIGYELTLEARRVLGNDFFCGLTFPYGSNHCTLILGGWGGALVGLSRTDRRDASENETTQFRNFEQGRWYSVRLRVERGCIRVWIDNEKLVDVSTAGKVIDLRPGDMYLTVPLGITTWNTTGEVRDLRLREVGAGAD